MWPLIAAGIGAGGSIASSLMGADAANQAQEQNWQINLLNYYQRERERQDRIREAAENKRDTKLGSTSADGSRTRFIDGVGWVTTLSNPAQKIQDAQQSEQLQTLRHDLPMKRRAMDRNEQRSLSDEMQADGLRRDMRSLRRNDDSVLESLLNQAGMQGVRRGYDESTAAISRDATRTGSGNLARLFRGINKDRAESYGRVALESKLKAYGSGDQEFNAKRDNLANLYNMFATRASVAPDVSYAPQNVGKTGDSMMMQGSKSMLAAGNALADAYGAKGGTMDYIQPNYGMANAVGTGANALAGLFRGAGGTGGYDFGFNKRLNY